MLKNIFLLFFSNLFFGQIQIGSDIDGEAAGDNSGCSVSLSSDGTIVAIGALNNDGNGINSGHVRIYKYLSGVWTQIGNDINGEATDDRSGSAVSLSGNGNIVAIRAMNNDGNGSNSGHVRIYQNLSGTWTQIGSDIDGEAAEDNILPAISLSQNGDIVAIGAANNDGNGSGSGHVRIYKNLSGTWTQIGSDIDGEAEGDNSGCSVSLSSDGSIVAIGAVFNDGNGPNSGHVRVFQNQSGYWTQIGNDIDGEAAEDLFGYSVSLSSNGDIVAIGATYNDGNSVDTGHVRIYQNISETWTQIGSDINGEAANDHSGNSVRLSSDGTVVIIGAANNDGNGSGSGHVRIYKNLSGTWTQIGNDIDSETAGDQFGRSVSLSSDGAIVAIGAINNDGNGSNSGHVRIYNLSSLLSSNNFDLSDFCMYPNPTSDVIQIIIQENQVLKKVSIYNELGQLVLTEINTNINVQNLSRGIYYCEIETTEGKASKKLIIN